MSLLSTFVAPVLCLLAFSSFPSSFVLPLVRCVVLFCSCCWCFSGYASLLPTSVAPVLRLLAFSSFPSSFVLLPLSDWIFAISSVSFFFLFFGVLRSPFLFLLLCVFHSSFLVFLLCIFRSPFLVFLLCIFCCSFLVFLLSFCPFLCILFLYLQLLRCSWVLFLHRDLRSHLVMFVVSTWKSPVSPGSSLLLFSLVECWCCSVVLHCRCSHGAVGWWLSCSQLQVLLYWSFCLIADDCYLHRVWENSNSLLRDVSSKCFMSNVGLRSLVR